MQLPEPMPERKNLRKLQKRIFCLVGEKNEYIVYHYIKRLGESHRVLFQQIFSYFSMEASIMASTQK